MYALINPTNLVSSFGYVAIFFLSVGQSCCVPTSSELTLGFAGALAATGRLNLAGAILAGASGEVVGAYLAWVIGRTAGRAIVDRYGKYVLLTQHDLDRAEAWYARHERWGVFGGRLVPVIRNFVALPAGVAEVPLVRFGLLTAAGSILWDGAMAGIGYGVGSSWHRIVHAFSDAGYVAGALALLALALAVVHRWRSYGAAVRTQAAVAVPAAPGLVPPGGGPQGTGPGAASAATTLADPAGAALEVRNPREELAALITRLAEPGAGVGERDGAAANERLTAAAGAVLLILLFLEGLTLVNVGGMMTLHVVIGLVLVPPILVKLGSTMWRFVRYYTGGPAFVRRGPPAALLRMLAPVLVLSTVVLFASGIALVAVHHPYGWLSVVHRYVFLLWFAVLTIHVLAYVWRVPGVVRRDVSTRRLYRLTSPRGRSLRLSLVAVSIALGAVLAALLWPSVAGQAHTFFHKHASSSAPRPAASAPATGGHAAGAQVADHSARKL